MRTALPEARPAGFNRRPVVLLVEDDESVATVYRIGLEMHGFEVKIVQDASGLFQALEVDLPDVIVLDYQLPGIMSGVDIVENLRLEPAADSLPILILSNHDGDDEGLAERALSAGALAWLHKSTVSPTGLALRLKDVLAADPAASFAD